MSAAGNTTRTIVPDRLAHVVLRTRQFRPMLEWWANLLQAEVVFENGFIGFLTFDDEHHRVAIVQPADLDDPAGYPAGLDHIAFTYASLGDLVATYERLKGQGIDATWVVNHGPTLSLYYRDPDGNRAELQIDRFRTNEEATAFLRSSAFSRHPIGHRVDFDDLARRFHEGEDEATLTAYKYDHENA
ncbi:VOC family protein [Streptomyces brasiliensis]|uniref:Biphenyl-2,3-diol 1,2-dioxygenase III n=1 Tax=Streptomyces brasiliensis TaxID=1954 RepID=A0A917L1Z4_9ACTN|nr:VOC family protein [Streptomyces brasiliensis]GGJ41175.1 putative biphenyl-2,3-diol 1,2-dioxygenase III [Streptomyces brasiliensis]